MAPPDYKYFFIVDLFNETEDQYVQTIGKLIMNSRQLQPLELIKDEEKQPLFNLDFTKCDSIPAYVTYLHVFGKIICSKKRIVLDFFSEMPSLYSAKLRTSLFMKIFNIMPLEDRKLPCNLYISSDEDSDVEDTDKVQQTVTVQDPLKPEPGDDEDVLVRKAMQILYELRKDRLESEARELKRKRNDETNNSFEDCSVSESVQSTEERGETSNLKRKREN